MELYRVFPYVASARPGEAGGALYIPHQGGGRLDNPDAYAVLYLGDSAAGAVAQAFGRFPEWTAAMLGRNPARGGSLPALARYTLPAAPDSAAARLCDLDDARTLLHWRLRPSQVVTRDYARTRAWARQIHARGNFAGVRWWSYYDADWGSLGLWDTRQLRLAAVEEIGLAHPALLAAAATIQRRIIRS